MNQAFGQLADKELEWWCSRGVPRPREFLVRPSGSLNALIACHVFNPTFCITDAHSESTYDLSNPSMSQINAAGFTTENSFFFHIPRRDISQHVDNCYPPELYNIYDSFLSALRNEIGAVVEVCWGYRVHEQIKTKTRLVPLTL
jgi:hypothetical protein